MLAATGSDRSVALYDVRSAEPLRKVVLSHKANAVAWNPQEPVNFTVASEDYNLYTFDMRNLARAIMIHRGHTNAV